MHNVLHLETSSAVPYCCWVVRLLPLFGWPRTFSPQAILYVVDEGARSDLSHNQVLSSLFCEFGNYGAACVHCLYFPLSRRGVVIKVDMILIVLRHNCVFAPLSNEYL